MFHTIEEAEQALLETNLTLGSSKIKIAKIAKAVKEKELFKDHISSKTGLYCKSFDEYLVDREEEWKRIANMGARRVRSLVGAYSLYVDQLEYDEEWLLAMGEHSYILAGVANTKNYELLKEDEPLPTGGTRLGAEKFAALVEATAPLVFEGKRKVKDTQDAVNSILGKTVQLELSKMVYLTADGDDKAKIDQLEIIFNGRRYAFSPDDQSSVRISDLRAWAERDHIKVTGIDNEELKEAHLY